MRADSVPLVHLRLGDLFYAIEDWRRAQTKIPARTDAIKELVKRGLEADQRDAVDTHATSRRWPEHRVGPLARLPPDA
jgi:hypothetical protein